jgi:ribosomal-protein-alanine N-acetyltransferase
LEVRASNEIAQELYRKYGFRVTGRRPRYYSSDGEDAIIMSTDNIGTPSFQASFQDLKEDYAGKHREILAHIH